MASSVMELQFGVFLVFADCIGMQKQTQTKYVYNLCTLCGILSMIIFMLKLQYIDSWRITVILIMGKP